MPDLAAIAGASGIASHDSDHAPDADRGGHRAGRFSLRDRRLGPVVQGRAEARSVQRLGVRVSQPVGDGAEDPGLRRPRVLALPQAVVQRRVPVVAGGQDRGGQDAGGPSVAGSLLGGQSRDHAGRAGVAAGGAGGLSAAVSRRVESRSRVKLLFTSFPILVLW